MAFTKAKIVMAGLAVTAVCIVAPQQLKAQVPEAQKRRRYLASNNLDRVEREYLNIPRDQIDNFLVQAYLEDRVDYAKTQKIPEAGQHINYVTIKKG